MSGNLLGAVGLGLLCLDRSQCLGVRYSMLSDIQFPQCPDEANGSARTLELEPVVGWLCKVNLTGGRSDSRPSEAIERAQGAQLWKVPTRLFAERSLPISGKRTRPRSEQDRHHVSHYSESGLNKHSLEVRNCSQPSPCQLMISSVQKNT